MYALDTNTVSYLLKGVGRVGERFLATPPTRIGIPSVVLFELEFGLVRSSRGEKRRNELGELLAHVAIMPFGPGEARAAALIRHELERSGRPIGPYDLLIAGTAMSHRATLVTHNTKELARVRGLTLEDWY